MKKSAIIKLITIILIISTFINLTPTISNASMLGEVIESGKDFLGTESSQDITQNINGGQIVNVSYSIYNVVLTLGVIVAVATIFILGIKFMTGSVEEKVQVKEMLIPFIIGCVVIFGALGIWRFVISIATKIT